MSERRGLVEWEGGEFSLTTQAKLLGLHRSGLYYQARPLSAAEVALKHRIDKIYTATLGSRKIAAQLRQEGYDTCRETVRRSMREMGLQAICPQPNLSQRRLEDKVYPYLLKNITASYPNHVWGIDITYIRLRGGWLYLVAILDWYSRYVVSWQLDDTLEMPFVLTAVDNQALAQATPVIWNSDQGSHFTSPEYTRCLLDAQVRISMDGRGWAMDNIFTERLWRSVKYEEVYLHDYETSRQATQGLATCLTFYNQKRLHQSLDYRTPAEVYLAVTPPADLDATLLDC